MLRHLTLSLVLAAALPFFAYAQISFPSLEPPASITAVPSSPAPGERVSLQAVTPVFDKDTTFYEWTINGQFRADLSGRGKYSAEVTAGPVGSAILVSVRATASDKLVATMSSTIRVSALALVWSADTSLPPWYTGKALASPGSLVTVVAIPQIVIAGKTVDPKNLVYQWGLGDEKKYATGVGKQSIQIETSRTPQASHWVRVTVEDIGRTVKKEGTIFITNRDPSVSIYRFSSTGGTEYRSAQTITQIAKGEALTLIAEPYYFPGKKTDILYRWDIGGLTVSGTAENPYLLTLQTETLPAASTLVSLLISSVKNAALAPITKTISLFIR
ncbi:MAG: hypothetical protein UY78_C0014G0006 [Parcubacteria group bacterium GW2011_GWA1_53_13]|uniref:PKD domain-containing protein n=1 Tax=Candidatus Adlerbacteria bacterium GW2011_GWC1_50_9 TaxID=1618608 RepID=A0A0G1WPB6_9BACT|nr:MAG: hypothetical protein UY61_C0027G0005 [Candidatus Adlerbacteria bacterium GW2011_GWC1_50_9]KKW33366.1 MAG: hypothetical protein UY78_C0014G0006 [Parcubacteria group bacterium GW2011_GWA1_53_13]